MNSEAKALSKKPEVRALLRRLTVNFLPFNLSYSESAVMETCIKAGLTESTTNGLARSYRKTAAGVAIIPDNPDARKVLMDVRRKPNNSI